MTRPKRIVISCRLSEENGRSISFDMTEFVEFNDGSRIVIRNDRGWGSKTSGDDPWKHQTFDQLASTATGLWDVYLDDEGGLAWAIPTLTFHGISTTPAELEALPVEVELGPETLKRLNQR